MSVVIKATGKCVPKKIFKNTDFDTSLGTSDEWIRSHTGIEARRIAEKGEKTSDYATEACKKVLEKAKVKFEEIDMLICATATSDYNGFPSSACVTQRKLGAKNACAFDVVAACAGFIYGLESATALLERSKKKYALVVGAELLSKALDWNDKSTCVLFGDGAGAVLLERREDCDERGIKSSILGADGDGEEFLFLNENGLIEMNGRAVYNFAVDKIASLIKDMMVKENLSIDEVDYIVCHQANERIIQAAAKRLHFPMEKFVLNLAQYGNTSAASIPITLDDMQEKGQLEKGSKIIVAGFGAGLTWGASYIIW